VTNQGAMADADKITVAQIRRCEWALRWLFRAQRHSSTYTRSNKRPRHHERPTSRSNEPRTQATQARDLSQLVREALAANVTSNGKRINHAAIWKAVGDNYQQPKTRCGPFLKPSAFQLTRIHRMDAAVVDMYHAARWIYRLVGPFLNIKTMFISGAYIEVSTGTINHSIFGY